MSYIGTEPKDIRSFGRTKFDYTASQGQTAFTGADDDGKVLAFTVGQIEVYVNGILMDDSDFTTTGTGTVTLASAANLNDVINIVSFESNIPDNDYVPASGGTFSGAVTHSGNVTVGGTLGVTGATTLTGNTTVGGTLGATGKITSTAGITFGSDTAAENVLDDYEEGTWTPHLDNGGTITNNYSSYVKIGSLVHAYSYLQLSSMPNDNSLTQIGGLPFNSTNNANYFAGGSLSYVGSNAASHFADPLVRYGNDWIYFHVLNSNGTAVRNSTFTGATWPIILTVNYHTH